MELQTIIYPSTADDANQQYVCLTLVLKFPPNYPDQQPLIELRNPRGLGEDFLANVLKLCHEKCDQFSGSPVIYEIIEVNSQIFFNIQNCNTFVDCSSCFVNASPTAIDRQVIALFACLIFIQMMFLLTLPATITFTPTAYHDFVKVCVSSGKRKMTKMLPIIRAGPIGKKRNQNKLVNLQVFQNVLSHLYQFSPSCSSLARYAERLLTST